LIGAQYRNLALSSVGPGSATKHGCFKVSLFHAANILVLVAFDGITLSYYQEFRFDTLSAARVSCLLGMA
jgi:hypothetical protein